MAISTERILGNTFLLVTIAVSYAAWIVAFGGMCSLGNVGTPWWINIYELIITGLITYTFMTDTYFQYRFAILTLLAISLAYLTLALEAFIGASRVGYGNGGAGAISAGFIVLSIVQFLWVLVFGSEPNTPFGQLIHQNNSIQQQPVHVAPVNVTSTPVVAATPVQVSSDKVAYEDAQPQSASPVLEYKERVEALHDYIANAEDPNELSFVRGETLEIVDRRGNWWQARKSDGTVGIIPSNYFA
ncbi:hypothetical protein DM01DRAFT_1339597 [Hesseltinella vesiculosa]|uniref:SH3 domain-containing protein n=1 Tax=Hesseltinella vesiculosa TaxID=101127 RepID=A0A1X2G6C6_9FUNG|nr:hypothetical protein DM01DRAFT_1339597 [Hesseltinella vesiculosa]